MGAAAFRTVVSPDGTRIACFSAGSGTPILLVHGTTADHSTFRTLGPRLAAWFATDAIDRRGRGESGDTQPYSIEREFEDVAAMADWLAAEAGRPIPVFGHSYGGRCALGAALLTRSIDRVICYEGAPAPPGRSYRPVGLEARLRERLAAGDPAGVLATFMTEVVGMTGPELDAFRADPIWPVRVHAAHTILRELEAEGSTAASLDALGRVHQPVLQLLGSASRPIFRAATVALDERLRDGRVAEIAGAKHAAHHTHPEVVVEAVRAFLA
ncbi:MAG TPA: alpha/beta hydrolase [Candidatus Limnocylindrales bacterium]|nr:alpha/beta hydrolase [Candidatus Limnocylindrales bacterium]